MGKKPLRKILNKYMDKNFAYGKKIGFPVSLNRIFNLKIRNIKNENYKIWFKKNIEELKKI